MTWQPELDEIAHRRRAALELGGAEKVERQRAAGKLTVRERIERLVDPGSFDEIGSVTGWSQYDDGKLTHFTPANIVCGLSRLQGRPAFVSFAPVRSRCQPHGEGLGKILIRMALRIP